jgi:uncharacterized cupin superfamily protein
MTHRIRISVDARINILEGVSRVTHELFSTENTLRQGDVVFSKHSLFCEDVSVNFAVMI